MRERRDRLGWFVLVSLFLHLIWIFLGARSLQPLRPEETELEVTLKNYRIADILPPEREERPEKADFAGLYDSKVPEEQVAATHRPAAPPSAPRGAGEGERLAARTPPEVPFGQLPEDFYPDYKQGEHTYLNVLRFPQVAYFVRMKKVFKTTFNPVPSLRRHAMANQIARGQVEVVLGVTVDRAGNLEELIVLNTSGLAGYDEESIRTVRDSSPFSAPPAELLGPDGRLRMSWTFTVYL